MSRCAVLRRSGPGAHATASESKGIIGLLERNESDFPSHSSSVNSCLGLSTSACARVSRVARAVALAGVCFGPSSSAESAAVVHAHATTLRTQFRWYWWPLACAEVYQLLLGRVWRRKGTKGGVSSPAEDLLLVSEVEAGVKFRPAGSVRRQVVGPLPNRQPGTGTRRAKGGAVTPSLHPEVPDTQFVSLRRGLGIRQPMAGDLCPEECRQSSYGTCQS